mmetsp:Transcript_127981/g.221150  ORF Transcript_127981/g.221150 Transcript_127981/m.221150 type:complete len:244 (+) Transcript_127981:935-1666(+)
MLFHLHRYQYLNLNKCLQGSLLEAGHAAACACLRWIYSQSLQVPFLQYSLREVCSQSSSMLLQQSLAFLFNDFLPAVLSLSCKIDLVDLTLPLRLPHLAPSFDQPLYLTIVLRSLLIALHGVHLLNPVVLCKFLHHDAPELLLLSLLVFNPCCLNTLLVLIGLNHCNPVTQTLFHTVLLSLAIRFLPQLLIVFNEDVLHLLLPAAFTLNLCRLFCQHLLLLDLLRVILTPHVLLPLVLLCHEP